MNSDSREAQSRLEKGLLEEQKAIDEQEKAGRLAAAEQAGVMREKQIQLQKDQIDIANRERERDLLVRNAEWEIRQTSEAIANQKIEAFKNKSTGQVIGLAIMAALTELGAGMRGAAPGKGLDMLNSFIERDLAEQRMEIEQKRGDLDTKRNLLAAMKDRFGDQKTAEDATRALMYKQIDAKLDGMAAENKALMESAQYKQLKAQLQQKGAEAFGSAMEGINKQALSVLNTKASVAANQEQLAVEKQNAIIKAKAGSQGKQIGETTIKEIAELQAAKKELESFKKEFADKTSPISALTKKIPYTDSYDYQKRRGHIVNKTIQRLTGAGVGVEEAKRITDEVPDAADWTPEANAKFDVAIQDIERELLLKLRALKQSGYDTAGLESNEPVASFR